MPPERGVGKLKYESGCCCPGLRGTLRRWLHGLEPCGRRGVIRSSALGTRPAAWLTGLGFPSLGSPAYHSAAARTRVSHPRLPRAGHRGVTPALLL
jgi:hypothetical protein